MSATPEASPAPPRVDPASGAITYAPDADFTGTDTFTYQACDATGACARATVSVAVTPVDDAPRPSADTATTPEDTPVVVDVLANDTDVEGDLDPATVTVISGPASGTVSVDPSTGAVTYAPDRDFNGTDAFTYQVCDPAGGCATGTVTRHRRRRQ